MNLNLSLEVVDVSVKHVLKILLYLVSLAMIYMLLMDFTPPYYPLYLLPPLFIGLIAGFTSSRKIELILLASTPIPIYFIGFLFSIKEAYTLNKVLATGPILYIPALYHLFLAFSTAVLIYNVKVLLKGRGGDTEESDFAEGALAEEG